MSSYALSMRVSTYWNKGENIFKDHYQKHKIIFELAIRCGFHLYRGKREHGTLVFVCFTRTLWKNNLDHLTTHTLCFLSIAN